MISDQELEAWTPLYDRGYNSFEVDAGTLEARDELDRALQLAYEREVQSGSISFRDFRRDVIQRIRAFLAKERRPPTI
jgi:hypothetical protein